MSEMLARIDRSIDVAAKLGIELRFLAMSEVAWKKFKSEVPRRQYRKRTGTRFINAYRGVPISIHDEWAYGWSTMPPIESPAA